MTGTSNRIPHGRVMETEATGPSNERTAPLHAAAAVVPVLNPLRKPGTKPKPKAQEPPPEPALA